MTDGLYLRLQDAAEIDDTLLEEVLERVHSGQIHPREVHLVLFEFEAPELDGPLLNWVDQAPNRAVSILALAEQHDYVHGWDVKVNMDGPDHSPTFTSKGWIEYDPNQGSERRRIEVGPFTRTGTRKNNMRHRTAAELLAAMLGAESGLTLSRGEESPPTQSHSSSEPIQGAKVLAKNYGAKLSWAEEFAVTLTVSTMDGKAYAFGPCVAASKKAARREAARHAQLLLAQWGANREKGEGLVS